MMMGWKVTYKPIDTEPKVNDIHAWNTALTIDEIQSIYRGEKRPEEVRPESYTSKPEPKAHYVHSWDTVTITKIEYDEFRAFQLYVERIRGVLRDKSLSSIRREEKIRVILDERARI